MAHNLWFPDDVMERAMRRERVFRDRSNLLEIYNNEDFIGRFRLPEEAIRSLTDELAEVLSPATSRSHSIPAFKTSPLVRVKAAGDPEFIKPLYH